MSRPYLVGLTGGLASGKSTVAGWLRDAGYQVVDADRLVADLYRPGGAGVEVVRRLFGDAAIAPSGGADHAVIARRIFADPVARRDLETAIHPLVRGRFEEIAAGLGPHEVAVLEATLLVEAGYTPVFDLIVTLEGDPEMRLRRAVARGLDESAARARLAAQGDGTRRRAGAQVVIDNDGSLEDLRRQVDDLIGRIEHIERIERIDLIERQRPPALSFALITGNANKLAEARRLVAGSGATLGHVDLDLPEIQSLDLLEVLRHKGEEAWRRLGRPLVVEEAGLDLAALGGFPGPLVKWMLEATGAEGLARVALALGEPRAEARCALYYRDAERTLVAEGRTAGTLVLPARGGEGFGWDPVFVPEGGDRTCGEISGAEKDAVSHRGRAWRALMAQLAAPG